MPLVHGILMIGGAVAMVAGFRLFGERADRVGWAGVALLFIGLGAAFLGVLLAFAPRFFG